MSYRKYLITSDEPPSELYKSVEVGTNMAEVGTDCISRQAAIDALTEYGNGRAVFISVGEAVIRIEQLPSAQPEEDCDTCKHGIFGSTQCNNCRVRYPIHYERRTDDGE